jgi:hypothetical protein
MKLYCLLGNRINVRHLISKLIWCHHRSFISVFINNTCLLLKITCHVRGFVYFQIVKQNSFCYCYFQFLTDLWEFVYTMYIKPLLKICIENNCILWDLTFCFFKWCLWMIRNYTFYSFFLKNWFTLLLFCFIFLFHHLKFLLFCFLASILCSSYFFRYKIAASF